MELHNAAKQAAGDFGLQVLSEDQLEGLQKVLLVIFDDVMEICRRFDLKYTVIGGTAIGALRHKGFIPWDDDVDIAMPRRDFEEFCKIVRRDYAEKYSMLHPQDRENYGRVIPKIRLKGTQYRTILERDLDECGIFIDIFPIENVPDNAFVRFCQGMMAMGFGFALACRRIYKGRREFRKMLSAPVFYAKCAIGFCLSFASIEKWAAWTDHWYSACKNENSRLVSIPSDERHFFGEINPRSMLCEMADGEFEGRPCKVPAQADPYLRDIYGDYMQIPPADKQVRNCYISYDLGKYDDIK